MNLEKLTGGTAVGAALVVWYTHGGDWTEVEIGALTAGAGAAITYVVRLAEKLFLKEES